jgi:hypothetical protein
MAQNLEFALRKRKVNMAQQPASMLGAANEAEMAVAPRPASTAARTAS